MQDAIAGDDHGSAAAAPPADAVGDPTTVSKRRGEGAPSADRTARAPTAAQAWAVASPPVTSDSWSAGRGAALPRRRTRRIIAGVSSAGTGLSIPVTS